MTLQEIFDSIKNEDGMVSVDAFNKAVKENKVKFTDLSEGRYVDKQKYLDELATKDTEIQTLNDTITNRDTDLEQLKAQLEEAGSDADKLKELTSNLASLQGKYDSDTKELQNRLEAQAYEFAVRDFASGLKFTSRAARKEFEREMIAKQLPMENGNIMGAKDWQKEYAKDNEDSFVKESRKQSASEPKPQFSSTATGKESSGSKMTLTELMQLKNSNPDAVINF